MRKLVLFAVLVTLLLTFSLAFAVPNNVTYQNTRRFLETMDDNEIKYSYMGIDDTNDEEVKTEFSYSGGSLSVRIWFTEDNELCSIRIWNLIDINPAYLDSAYRICNDLNSKYKYTTFYVDTSDNSITVSLDVILRNTASSGEIAYEGLMHILSIADQAYEDLKPLEK